MLHHPLAIIAVLIGIESLVLWLANHPRTKKYFDFLPPVFWMYFFSMLLSSMGFLDSRHPVLKKISDTFLPVSLFIILLSVNLPAIARLGSQALLMFGAACLGMVVGVPTAFWLFKDQVGTELWSSFGALAGSWTGGSANLIAVKEALGASDTVFSPIVVVDTIIPYFWMGTLVALAAAQPIFDRWNRSRVDFLDDLQKNLANVEATRMVKFDWVKMAGLLGLALVVSILAHTLSKLLPQIKGIISGFTWVVILATTAGIGGSLTPLRSLERWGATKLGYVVLYFVLTTIGARASLTNLGAAVYLLSAGMVIVLIHAIFLLVAARLLRAPLFLVATASQAAIGGVASAPVVAEIYRPGLSSLGLLLAILGNIVGTYLGILAGKLCLWSASF